MKKFLLVFFVVVIAAGGTYFALVTFDNKAETKQENLTMNEILNTIEDTDIEEIEILTRDIEEEIMTGNTEELEDSESTLDVIFSIETSTEMTSIKGDISNVEEGLVQRVDVVACDGNLNSEYNDPYTLKKYEYPNFQYNIKGEWDNVCLTPYEVIFYGSGDVEIDRQEYSLDKSIVKSIKLGTKKYESLNYGIMFDYPNILQVSTEIGSIPGDQVSAGNGWNANKHKTGAYVIQIEQETESCEKYIPNFTKEEVGSTIIYKSTKKRETSQGLWDVICVSLKKFNTVVQILERDDFSQAKNIVFDSFQIIPETTAEDMKNLKVDSISVNKNNIVSLSADSVKWYVTFKNEGDVALKISDKFPVEVSCGIKDFGKMIQHNLNWDFNNKIINSDEQVILTFNSDVYKGGDNIQPEKFTGTCYFNREGINKIKKIIDIQVSE